MKKITFQAKSDGKVLKLLSEYADGVPYSALQAALRKKDVRVSGVKVDENVSVAEGDEITVFLPDNAEKKSYSVVYEDENVLFVDKAKGIEVCNGDYNLVKKLAEQGKTVLPVHRLDRNTTGLVMFAKSQDALNAFKRALGEGRIRKIYHAEVVGQTKESDCFTDYIVKDAEKSVVKVYSSPVRGGEKAITKYVRRKKNGNVSLLEVEISEGKTHQIRASLAYHGLPIIGDGKYGDGDVNRAFHEKSQRLRAVKLLFNFDENSLLNYLNAKNISVE